MMYVSTLLRSIAFVVIAGFLAVGCSNVSEPNNSAEPTSSTNKNTGTISAPEAGTGFTMVLIESGVEDPNTPGQFFWSWEISQNDGQKFGINHITLYLNSCVTSASIIEAYRSDDGINWSKEANMQIGDNASAGCDDNFDPLRLVTIPNVSSPVGYIRLVLNTAYITQEGTAIWKAGPQCGTTNYIGMGCEEGGGGQGDNEGCSYSLGFYFASPVSAGTATPGWGWSTGGVVTIGGFDYTEVEARAIFSSKNGKTGMTPAKLSFLQVVAIMLSSETVSPTASVWEDYWICYNYLDELTDYHGVKLTAENVNSFGKTPKFVQSAAGRIGQWIDSHHCDDLTP